MEPRMSKETAALIKSLLYEEVALSQEAGDRKQANATLDAINEFNLLLDKEYAMN